jgi:exodeoxyribonuclease V beta subunit
MSGLFDQGQPLEWQHMPLAGRVLIEASAGTGKTHTISLIYLRLIVEQGLAAEKIVVATFTEAAAQELLERLRAQLVLAEQLLHANAADVKEEARALQQWLRDLCADEAEEQRILRRIRLARADIDRAPIATIHALCQHIQRDFPLESGASFAAGGLVDEGELLRECLEDFWRRRYLGASVPAAEAQFVLPDGPAGLLEDLRRMLGNDATVLRPETDGTERLLEALGAPAHVAELRRWVDDRTLYAPRRTALRTRFVEIADALDSGTGVDGILTAPTAACLEADKIGDQLSESGRARLADSLLLETLRQIRGALLSRSDRIRGIVLADALAFCRDEIPRRARRRDAQTFAMLIDNTHARVAIDDILADRLFEAFPAALIDEFQDTDRKQFGIFDRIYRDAGGQPRGLLTMIGDPKQAIFAFRGGDVAAYLYARAQTEQRFSLEHNFRSTSELVRACNSLYARTDGGFDDARIRYQEVQSAAKANAEPYAIGGRTVARPFFLHRVRTTDAGGGALSAAKGEEAALKDCADRIVELLNDRTHTIGGRPVVPGDVAVLMPTNAQIATMRKYLAGRGVPCVGSGRGSVFNTDIAREFELVVYAVLNAEDERSVRAALCTRLLGADLDDVRCWRDDGAAFERELERFADWRAQVQASGIAALIPAVLAQRGAALLASGDGERMITDLRHIGELLAEEDGGAHALDGALARLQALRNDESEPSGESEARRLRIESDAARVQLLTIHAAKGQQFPIVFLPLAWRRPNVQRSTRILRFHDREGRAYFDLGSPDFDANRARDAEEERQERLRLLYVALTRAMYALHVYCIDPAAESPDADGVSAIGLLLRSAQNRLRTAGNDSLAGLAGGLDGVALVEPFSGTFARHAPSTPSAVPRAPRTPLPAVRPFVWLHSFSGILRNTPALGVAPAAADENDPPPDTDNDATAAGTGDDPLLIAIDEWRGRRFGNAAHRVLEVAEPGPVWPQQRELLRREFLREALAGSNLEPVGRLFDRVRASDLGDGVRLIDIAADARISEFEFQFPVNGVALTALRTLCDRHGCAGLLPITLSQARLNGMLTGFADLIFFHHGRYHVLDYKTNRLGTRRSDYAATALDAAMAAHHYPLQAFLYTLALHRYLRHRVAGYAPDTHLGDSWYLFLRGVGLQPGLGVWRRRWPAALIEEASAIFAGREAAA